MDSGTFSVNLSTRRSMKNRHGYNSVERRVLNTGATGLARYNNLLKSKNPKKPATSNYKQLPLINSSKGPRKLLQDGMNTKPNFSMKHHGLMSLSPFRDNSDLDPSKSRYINENRRVIGREKDVPLHWKDGSHTSTTKGVIQREKVSFKPESNNTFSRLFTTDQDNHDRFYYIIPEGSDVISESLNVVKINLTDYVKALLPKDKHGMTNAKVQRMGPYEKLEAVKPSKQMQHQVLKSIISELVEVMPR